MNENVELLDFNLTIKKKSNVVLIYVYDLNLFSKGKNINDFKN